MYRYVCYFTYQGTSDLSLRIRLNSGPTTAGVLRGEKARFQLFGDVSGYISCTSSIDEIVVTGLFMSNAFLHNFHSFAYV
jgi:hypothetical protein